MSCGLALPTATTAVLGLLRWSRAQLSHDGLLSVVGGVAGALQVGLPLLLAGALVLLGRQGPEDAAVAGVVVLAVLGPDQDGGEAGQLVADVLQTGGHTVPA